MWFSRLLSCLYGYYDSGGRAYTIAFCYHLSDIMCDSFLSLMPFSSIWARMSSVRFCFPPLSSHCQTHPWAPQLLLIGLGGLLPDKRILTGISLDLCAINILNFKAYKLGINKHLDYLSECSADMHREWSSAACEAQSYLLHHLYMWLRLRWCRDALLWHQVRVLDHFQE